MVPIPLEGDGVSSLCLDVRIGDAERPGADVRHLAQNCVAMA